MLSSDASLQSISSVCGDDDLMAVQRQLVAIQDKKQAFLQDLAPMSHQQSLPEVSASPQTSSVEPKSLPPDLSQFLKESAQVDQDLHFEYCALNAQSTTERTNILQQYIDWQAEDAKKLTEMANKRRAIQAAYIAEREAILVRHYEDQLAHLQSENAKLRAALLAAHSTRRPDLGFEVTSTYHRGQRGAEVVSALGVALEAGAEAGDVLVGIGWHCKVDSTAAYLEAASRVRPGDLVTIDGYRNGRPLTFHIVAKAPGGEPMAFAQSPRPGSARGRHIERPMFRFPLTDRVSADVRYTSPHRQPSPYDINSALPEPIGPEVVHAAFRDAPLHEMRHTSPALQQRWTSPSVSGRPRSASGAQVPLLWPSAAPEFASSAPPSAPPVTGYASTNGPFLSSPPLRTNPWR